MYTPKKVVFNSDSSSNRSSFGAFYMGTLWIGRWRSWSRYFCISKKKAFACFSVFFGLPDPLLLSLFTWVTVVEDRFFRFYYTFTFYKIRDVVNNTCLSSGKGRKIRIGRVEQSKLARTLHEIKFYAGFFCAWVGKLFFLL